MNRMRVRLAGRSPMMFAVVFVALVVAAMAGLRLHTARAAASRAAANSHAMGATAGVREHLASLPLSFVPNKGQFDSSVRYEALTMGYSAALTDDGTVITLHSPRAKDGSGQKASFGVKLAGAEKLQYTPAQKQRTVANYYVGQDQSKWATNVATYGTLEANAYPGIKAKYQGSQSDLRYDFVVAPGADPSVIQLDIQGARKVSLQNNGDLKIETAIGPITQQKPYIYQEINGKRKQVEGHYQLNGEVVTIALAQYDKRAELVIDPTFVFSTLVGGVLTSTVNAVGSDEDSVYVTGQTTANTTPTGFAFVNDATAIPTNGLHALASGDPSDAFAVSMNRNGTAVNWWTFFGGSANDSGNALAVANPIAKGSITSQPAMVWVAGTTFSADLGQAANTYAGSPAAFYAQFMTINGNIPTKGTGYVASPASATGTSITVRGFGAPTDVVYIGGTTGATISSPVFPNNYGAFAGVTSAFIAAFTAGNPFHNPATQNPFAVRYFAATTDAEINALTEYPYQFSAATGFVVSGVTFTGGDNSCTTVHFNGGGFTTQAQGQVFNLGSNTNAVLITTPGAGYTSVPTVTFNGGCFATATALLSPVTLTNEVSVAFAGQTAGGGLVGATGSVQANHGGYGGGAHDGIWGTVSGDLSTVNNYDYFGGAGDDMLRGIAAAPNGTLAVVGDTTSLPPTTTCNGSCVIQAYNPVINTNGPTGGRDVFEGVITLTNTAWAGTPPTANILGSLASVAINTGGATCNNGIFSGVAIGGGGSTTSATITETVAGGALTSVVVTSPGVGFNTNALALPALAGCGTQPTVTFNLAAEVVSLTGGTGGGAGYLNPPALTFTGAGGSGATGVATINQNGTITGFVLTNTGSNYTKIPTVGVAGLPSVPNFAAIDYLGGSGNEFGYGIGFDMIGNSYIVGQTLSADFPTENPFTGGGAINGPSDAFLTRLMPNGHYTDPTNTYGFSSYIGGSNNDSALGVSVDNIESVFVGGQTFSPNFPTSVNAVDTSFPNTATEEGFVLNALFNDMTVTPGSPVYFSTTYNGAAPPAQVFQVSFANAIPPPAPGFTVTVSNYSANGNGWLTPAIGGSGFSLSANPAGLGPGTYTAIVTVTPNPGTDSAPVVINVTFELTASFTGAGALTFNYTKVEANPASVSPAQFEDIGFTGMPNTCNGPTFTATPAYQTGGSFGFFTLNGQTNGTTVASNFNSGVCGNNLIISLVPAVLDAVTTNGPIPPPNVVGSITLSLNGVPTVTIPVNVNLTTRLLVNPKSSPPNPIVYNFNNNSGGQVTEPFLLRAENDVVNITSGESSGNGQMPVLVITSIPTSAPNAACLANAWVPAGFYVAPSSSDINTSDLSLPITIGEVGSCTPGTYSGTLTVKVGGDTLDTIVTPTNGPVVGPTENPVAYTTLTWPVQINIGNTLKLTGQGPFNFDTAGSPYVINDLQGNNCGAGVPPGSAPFPGTAPCVNPVLTNTFTPTISTTIQPTGSNYQVVCQEAFNTPSNDYNINNGNPYSVPANGQCGWLDINASTGSASTTTNPTLTLSLDPSAFSLPTVDGNNATPYQITFWLVNTGGTGANTSSVYTVNYYVARQPLSWSTSIGGAPPVTNFPAVALGSGNPANQTCGNISTIDEGSPTLDSYGNEGVYYGVITAPLGAWAGSSNTSFPNVNSPVTSGWLTVTPNGPAWNRLGSPFANTLTCSVNITNLAPGTYYASIDAVSTSNAGTIRSLGTVTMTVAPPPVLNSSPTGFQFVDVIGGPAPGAQTLTITNQDANFTVNNVVVTPSTNGGGNWLLYNGSTAATNLGNIAHGVAVANPVTVNLAALPQSGGNPVPGTYTGTLSVTDNNGSPTVNNILVTLIVSSQPVIVPAPTSLTFNQYQGFGNPPSQTVSVPTIPAAGETVTVASAPAFITTSIVNGVMTVTANTGALTAAGSPYTGNIVLNATGTAGPALPVNVPVTFNITATPTITPNPTSVSVQGTVGAPNPGQQEVFLTVNNINGNVAGGGLIPLTSVVNNYSVNGTGWLTAQLGTASPTSATTVTLNFNIAGLTGTQAGTVYTANVVITSPNVATVTIPVTLTVYIQPTFTVTPNSVSAAFTIGGSTTPICTNGINVQTTVNGLILTVTNIPAWATVVQTGGTTPTTLNVCLNPNGMAAGTYTQNLTLSAPPAIPSSIALSMTISAQPVLVAPAAGAYTYTWGGPLPAGQNFAVSSSFGPAITGLALTQTGSCTWLTAALAGSSTATTINTSLNAANQPAAPGTYTCTLTVNGTGGPQTAPAIASNTVVTLTVVQYAFFNGTTNGGAGTLLLQFPDGTPFGYYVYTGGNWIYHADLGYEYILPAHDAANGVYMYDLKSGHWWYTDPAVFPYIYDFNLTYTVSGVQHTGTFIYYFPNGSLQYHYLTNPRVFANMTTGVIFNQ